MTTVRAWVLDASALLALLFDEPGGEMAKERSGHRSARPVNLSEVMHKSLKRGVGVEKHGATTCTPLRVGMRSAGSLVDKGLHSHDGRL